jgi:hypothetical protein
LTERLAARTAKLETGAGDKDAPETGDQVTGECLRALV